MATTDNAQRVNIVQQFERLIARDQSAFERKAYRLNVAL